MDKYVIDAGPLIHMDQIGHLKILKKLPSLILPPSIIQEIKHDTISTELKSLETWPNIKIVSSSPHMHNQLNTIMKKFPLHRGEIDCLHLAIQLESAIFLTDDLAARNAAEKLRIEVHGTIGLITYAVRKKWLPLDKAEEALNLLYNQSSLFVTYAIVEQAISSLKKTL